MENGLVRQFKSRGFYYFKGRINSIAFSPDGRWALSGSETSQGSDQNVCLWEVRSGKDSLEFVTADREFIGTTWFAYLCKEKIPLRIRIRENLLVTTANGRKRVAARNLFRTQKKGVGVLLSGRRRLLGQELFLMGVRNAAGEYVIVASKDEWGLEFAFFRFDHYFFSPKYTERNFRMKIDRSVKVMLMLIAVLLALNFAKDVKLSAHSNDNSKNTKSSLFENTVEAAPPPSFLQVGKSYESSAGGFIVLELQSTGWVKARSTSNEITWFNSNALTYITPRN